MTNDMTKSIKPTKRTKHMIRIAVGIFAAVSITPSVLLANEDVMAPPTAADSRSSHAVHLADTHEDLTAEDAPDLRDTLNSNAEGSDIDVRSYQRKDGTHITEYGQKGKVFRIKVQPPGGLPAYYLYRNTAGHFERRLPGGSKSLVAPSWILKEF